jgi:hypothetical protein
MSSRQVVRKPVRLREGSSRAFEQGLFTRLPWLTAPSLRLVARLQPNSRLRRALVWRGMRLSAEAFNRRDLDATVCVGAVRCLGSFTTHMPGRLPRERSY